LHVHISACISRRGTTHPHPTHPLSPTCIKPILAHRGTLKLQNTSNILERERREREKREREERRESKRAYVCGKKKEKERERERERER
jgi:hypothetical protein